MARKPTGKPPAKPPGKPRTSDARASRGGSKKAATRTTGSRQQKEVRMANNDTPKHAGFVERVVSDAKNPPETRMLTGWLGESGEEGYKRVYTDAKRSASVRIWVYRILTARP